MKLASYPEYQYSGVAVLGSIPLHWAVRRQRTVVEIIVSNVDKNTVEGEMPVRLCNYVDVYKHERITRRIPFMLATASAEEVSRFRLEVGDVIITKDSEGWNDIGVPSLVEYSAPDLICGYHLAVLRPRRALVDSAFLLRALQSTGVALQFHVSANGITRYGLAHNAIKDVRLPVPPLPEQESIARFLDYKDRCIGRLIHAKRRQIELLNEEKQAIIQRAVTRTLDPNVRLKPSGIEWLGDVPAHWEVKPAKGFFREVDERSPNGHEELLSVSHLTGVTPRSHKNVTMFMAESYIGHKLCREGDLVVNTMWAWMGALGVSRWLGIVSPSYAVYRPINARDFLSGFADFLLRTAPYVAEYRCRSTGIRSSRLRLYPEDFLRIPLVHPPLAEQSAILDYVHSKTGNAERAIKVAQREIDLIREYRARLIADVVTGQVDVRELELPLLKEIESSEAWDEAENEEDERDEIGEVGVGAD